MSKKGSETSPREFKSGKFTRFETLNGRWQMPGIQPLSQKEREWVNSAGHGRTKNKKATLARFIAKTSDVATAIATRATDKSHARHITAAAHAGRHLLKCSLYS